MIFPISESELIGLLGTAIIILAYFLLQIGVFCGTDRRYILLNLLGSCGVMVSLMHDWNLAGVIINGFWIFISLMGLFWRSSLDSDASER